MDQYVTCRECTQLLHDYLDSHLSPEITQRLEEHLAECPPCVQFLSTYRSCSKMIHSLRDREVELPLKLCEKLQTFLRKERQIEND